LGRPFSTSDKRILAEFGQTMTRPRRSGLKQIRWAVYLRGQLLGHVYADNRPAACERAVRRWKISRQDQEELVVEKDDE
jgi:hypothetical protein